MMPGRGKSLAERQERPTKSHGGGVGGVSSGQVMRPPFG
jgi:hypothetical protein